MAGGSRKRRPHNTPSDNGGYKKAKLHLKIMLPKLILIQSLQLKLSTIKHTNTFMAWRSSVMMGDQLCNFIFP